MNLDRLKPIFKRLIFDAFNFLCPINAYSSSYYPKDYYMAIVSQARNGKHSHTKLDSISQKQAQIQISAK